MKIDLSGKKALVGGSSKGIGLGIARQLAESGASVCLMARNESRLKEIVDGYICAQDTGKGRPQPHMLNKLMYDFSINCPTQVCKVGDTVLDVKEGNNFGAGLVVSVLSGECMYEQLVDQGQHMILDNITHLELAW